MNVFLRTRLFRDAISSSPDSLRVDYRSAYSIVPGRIHVEGLLVRGRDSSVEWILALDRCDFRVSFLALARKKFDASRARRRPELAGPVAKAGRVVRRRSRRCRPCRAFSIRPWRTPGRRRLLSPTPTTISGRSRSTTSTPTTFASCGSTRFAIPGTSRCAGAGSSGRFAGSMWGPRGVTLRTLDVSYGASEPGSPAPPES